VLDFRLYLAQRLSGLIMAPLVLLHLGVMVYAIQGGLNAEEILSRTRGSAFWGCAYGLFVLTVSIHATIGLRAIAHEWFRVSGRALDWLAVLIGIGLLGLGGRAVYAVVLS